MKQFFKGIYYLIRHPRMFVREWRRSFREVSRGR